MHAETLGEFRYLKINEAEVLLLATLSGKKTFG